MTTEAVLYILVGPFDAETAMRIRDELEHLPADQPVTLDFTKARVPSLCTLTAFFEAMTRLGPRPLATRGLSAHQLTVLRYCGLDLEALGWEHHELSASA